MQAINIIHMFGGLSFEKTATEIASKMKEKVGKLRAKVEERQKRIADLRKAHDIDDSDLIQLLQQARKQANSSASQYSYSKSANMGGGKTVMEERSIGAGVVNHLLTESDYIDSEKDQADRLELMASNLRPIPRFATGNGASIPPEDFALTYDELKYLGF